MITTLILLASVAKASNQTSNADCERLLSGNDDLKTLIRIYDARLEDSKADLTDLIRLYRLRLSETHHE